MPSTAVLFWTTHFLPHFAQPICPRHLYDRSLLVISRECRQALCTSNTSTVRAAAAVSLSCLPSSHFTPLSCLNILGNRTPVRILPLTNRSLCRLSTALTLIKQRPTLLPQPQLPSPFLLSAPSVCSTTSLVQCSVLVRTARCAMPFIVRQLLTSHSSCSIRSDRMAAGRLK